MSEKSIDGFEIHYPAPPPLVLDGKPLDKKINETSEKLAYGCNIYEVSPDGDDYILHSQFKLFHFRYKGGLASCSCNDFTYATGTPAAMCEHIAAFLKVSNNFSTRIKPLDAKPGLRGLIEKFCSANSIECKLTPGTAQPKAEPERPKEVPKPPPVAKEHEQARVETPKPPENVVKEPLKPAEPPVNTAKVPTGLSFCVKEASISPVEALSARATVTRRGPRSLRKRQLKSRQRLCLRSRNQPNRQQRRNQMPS